MSAALCALQEAIQQDPKPYKNLIPSFVSILKQVSNLPLMLIRLGNLLNPQQSGHACLLLWPGLAILSWIPPVLTRRCCAGVRA